MVNAKKYFNTEYWDNYDWYRFRQNRKNFYRDTFYVDLDMRRKDKIKDFIKSIIVHPHKHIKSFIYYLPACWYMIKGWTYFKFNKEYYFDL